MHLLQSKTYLEDLDCAVQCSLGIEQLRGKTVLITGAGGTIGSFLADTLLHYNRTASANISVIAAGRNIERLKARFGTDGKDGLSFVMHDNLRPVGFGFSSDYILHTASNATPAAFREDPVGTVMGIIDGTCNLLKYAAEHGTKRFLYVSTGEVYGQGEGAPCEFREQYSGPLDNTDVRACYPSAKRTAENLCAGFYRQFGLETVIARPCHTFGPTMTAADNRAHAQFFRNAINEKDIILTSEGRQMRSYAYIADCASSILTVLLKGTGGEAYNIANPVCRVSISELANEIAAAAGVKVGYQIPTATDLAERTIIPNQILNCEKLESLGWKGRYDIPKGISHTIRILKEI